MAIKAFNKAGQVRKNPLLGTSLLSDPGRAEQREQFMSLHAEAKENPNEGRAGMLGKLAERFQEFGGPEVERLDVIKRRQANLASQANDLRLEGIGTAQDRLDSLRRMEAGDIDTADDPLRAEFKEAWKINSRTKGGPGILKGKNSKAFMKDIWMPREMEAAEANYSQAFDAASEDYYSQLGVLGQSHEALTLEQKEREGKLAARAGMYNMFLGA
jgi:hypothetical protein